MTWIKLSSVCKVLVWLELFPPRSTRFELGMIHLLKLTFVKSMEWFVFCIFLCPVFEFE